MYTDIGRKHTCFWICVGVTWHVSAQSIDLFKQCAHYPYRRIYELSWEKLSWPGNKFRPASIQRSEALSSNFLKVAMLSELRPAASRFTGGSGNNWLFKRTLLTQPLHFPARSFFYYLEFDYLWTKEKRERAICLSLLFVPETIQNVYNYPALTVFMRGRWSPNTGAGRSWHALWQCFNFTVKGCNYTTVLSFALYFSFSLPFSLFVCRCPLIGSVGALIGLAVSVRDISALKQHH